MAKKFVMVRGLHNIFESGTTTYKTTKLLPTVDSDVISEESICFITPDDTDKDFNADYDGQYIWTHGTLFTCKDITNVSDLNNDAGYITDTTVPVAKTNVVGGVKVNGYNLTIENDGLLKAKSYTATDFDIKDLTDTTGLRTSWTNKQDALTQGTGISIDTANTISCTVVNTDTHRPIKVDGVEKLGDNVTPLNLSGGTNINLSTDSAGTVTINSVNTAYVAGDTITIDSASTINVANWFLPIGSITMWASNTVPEGWLMCNGQAISGDSRYTALRDILGTDTVPDLTGRFPLGVNGSHVLNSTGGTETETLTVDQIPSHNHEIKDLIHEAGTLSTTYRTFNLNSMGTAPTTVETLNPVQHTENTGGGLSHNNMPPYFAINFIIKYK